MTNVLGYYSIVSRCIVQGSYSQHFIFFVTYEWDQYSRLFQYTNLERLANDKSTSLLGPLVNYEENEVL